ncbi:hypothetical protein [Nonomuraea basaltis]|uniref:hypothetical protein n=1 Tax=Nonomuraea basaltis TaxID=2495887 RepID=UPI00110C5715|nr:hypothetical protein [Nonomuraea basaltis]TMR99554.1 hypothetical protein EJK15_07005 [Nonomuraea basaltis]
MEEWWYRLTRRQRWIVCAAMAVYFALSFVNAGLWSFITALLTLTFGWLFGVMYGSELARRETARRLELTDSQYENAVTTAMKAVEDNARLTGELIETRKDLAAAHLRQATLRALLNEAGITVADDDTEEIDLIPEVQPHP